MSHHSLASELSGTLGRFSPDSRRWRLRVAGLAAVGAPLAFYGAFAVASGVKSGMVYNLLVLVFGVLALALPVVGTAALLAPESGLSRPKSPDAEDPVETLKRRYAAGDIDETEFDRRLDDLMETSATGNRRQSDVARADRSAADDELDRAVE